MEVVTVDKAGRLVLPSSIRKRVGIKDKSKLLVIDIEKDTILLKKLDRDEISRRLKQELGGVDVEKVAREVRAELNEEVKKEHPEIFP